ncbi:MAG: hypothetical protein WC282_04600 [Bacilli bacterium]
MHHTKMHVQLGLDHFLKVLGENIGTIGSTSEILRIFRSKWLNYERIEDKLKNRLGKYYPEGAEILRAIDKAQDKIISEILELCAVILTENQKSNYYLSLYDPLAKVDQLRRLLEITRRNASQTMLFKEAQNAAYQINSLSCRRSSKGYSKTSRRRTMGLPNFARAGRTFSFFSQEKRALA